MNITVEMRLTPNQADSVVAYATLILDGSLVVHDLKVIRRRTPGALGDRYMVAMPSKKILHPCQHCPEKNHLRANYCGGCGRPLEHGTPPEPNKWYADMIHPIDPEARRRVHFAVMSAYRAEILRVRAKYELPTDGTPTSESDPQHPRPLPAVGAVGGPGSDRGEDGE